MIDKIQLLNYLHKTKLTCLCVLKPDFRLFSEQHKFTCVAYNTVRGGMNVY